MFCDEPRILIERIEIGDAHALVRIRREHPAEVGHREPEHHVPADRFLRELADVLDRALVDVDAAGDVAVEEERLGEGELIVFGARAGLQRHA